jgi:hypothetical protein
VNSLEDYSGELLPNLKLEDLKHNTLAETLRLYTKLLYGLDGIWYRKIREIIDDEKALACDLATWEDFLKYEVTMIKRQFRIRGNDLITYLKVTQLTPWYQLTDSIIYVEDKKRATIIVTSCPILESLEKKESSWEAERTCRIVCPRLTEKATKAINPDIQAAPSKLPPRQSKDEICCRWEFSLMSK